MWTFMFYGTDANENRAHVHVGKKGIHRFAKIWLEPQIELAENGVIKRHTSKTSIGNYRKIPRLVIGTMAALCFRL